MKKAVRADQPQTLTARGPWHLTWRRLRRDRVALGSAVALVLIVLAVSFGGAVVGRLVGHTGSDRFPYAVDAKLRPAGLWSRVPASRATRIDEYGRLLPPPPHARRTLLVLGADGVLGRDELIRLLDGGRVSLEIAVGGVIVGLLLGAPLGALAGYFGGPVDAAVSRLTELVMAFPLLLLLILVGSRFSDSLTGLTVHGLFEPGVCSVALLIGMFSWFYPARIVRSQLLTLRTSEFVQAARMIGAGHGRILRTHLLPHLVPALLAYSAVALGTNILLEVGVTFLGVGVQATTATWGSMLSSTWGSVLTPRPYDPNQYTPWLTLLPTLAIFVTVASFNQLGDGLRAALETEAA